MASIRPLRALLRGEGRPVEGGMMLSSPEVAMGRTGVRTPSTIS